MWVVFERWTLHKGMVTFVNVLLQQLSKNFKRCHSLYSYFQMVWLVRCGLVTRDHFHHITYIIVAHLERITKSKTLIHTLGSYFYMHYTCKWNIKIIQLILRNQIKNKNLKVHNFFNSHAFYFLFLLSYSFLLRLVDCVRMRM